MSFDWLEVKPAPNVAVELADADGEEVGVGRVAEVDWDDAGKLVVVEEDDPLDTGGWVVVEELRETAPPVAPPPAVSAPDRELAGLFGMVPVLEPSILCPVEIGGESAFMRIDWVGPKHTLSLDFGTKLPLVDSWDRVSLPSSAEGI